MRCAAAALYVCCSAAPSPAPARGWQAPTPPWLGRTVPPTPGWPWWMAVNYEASWDSAAALFRAAVTRSDWQTSLMKARAPFGPIRGRTLLSAA